jgi:excisionase family DNA binding protein
MADVRLLSYSQVAERLGVDRRTVRKMVGLRQLPGTWVGDRYLVPEPAVDEFVRDARAARIGTAAALRALVALTAALDEAPHVTGEDGR